MFDLDTKWLLEKKPDATEKEIDMFIEKVSYLIECLGTEEGRARLYVLSMMEHSKKEYRKRNASGAE